MRNVGKNRKSNRKKDGKKEENAGRIRNTRTKDSGAKLIFDNHILCAQFLRGYTDVDLLKDVQAEDIEDITERFLWMWQEGRDSDSVKKIRLKGIPGVETLYLIVLIEHQSKVDHDMPFRMLRYIVQVLTDYAQEQEKKKKGIRGHALEGKNIALIFEKPSTRTRCAFTVAANDEGGFPTYLSGNEIQLGHKESVEDTARVLGRMFDGIEFRGFRHSHVELLAKYSGVPVWNGLTDDYHPTQVLADLLTIQEHFQYFEGLKFVYIGDGRNNMANSLMIGCAKVGIDFVLIAPSELWPMRSLVRTCQEYADASGSTITISDNTNDVEGADIIYTDVWISMGEEEKTDERKALLHKYQVNRKLMEKTQKDTTIFMHCLPAVKGYEVTEDVFESPASVVFDEAENRLHTIKAVMVATLGEE